MVLWIKNLYILSFDYGTITLFGETFQPSSSTNHIILCSVLTPVETGLGSFPFARRYLGNLYLISFPQGTEMFHFPWFALTPLDVSDITVGLPHSDTLGYYAPYQLT